MDSAYAHLGGAGGEPHSLRDHSRAVAGLARVFARAAAPMDTDFARAADCAGWLHDLGKLRPAFQDYLQGRRGSDKQTRHSVFGAAAIAGRSPAAAFAILGHHAGLHDLSELQDRSGTPSSTR